MSSLPSSDASTLAQQALERAKAIAAKLSGTVPGTDATPAATKRRRWDEPNAGGGPNNDDEGKRAKLTVNGSLAAANSTTAAGTASSATTAHEKRIWITTSDERPAQHYVLHLADHLASLNESNALDDSDASKGVSAKLLGKGTDEVVVPGWPQLPLHILLTAPSHQQLTAVADKIQEWIDEADRAEPLNYEEQALAVRQTPVDLAGRASATSSYRPASVAQLIHGTGLASQDTPFTHEKTIGVPHSVVGYIIGRGGSTLAQIQASSGVSVQIQKESELEPGQTQRLITLSAHDEQSLLDGQRQIEKLVREKCGPLAAGGPGLGFTKKNLFDAKLQEAIDAGHKHVTLNVPEDVVGLVIGKQGSTIRQIQDSTGCHVQVMPPESSDDTSDKKGEADEPKTRAVHITHPTDQGAQEAKAMIEAIIKSKPPTLGGGASYTGSSTMTIQVAVPDRDVGLCIGKQGSVIRQIQNMTNCRIQIPPQCGPGETHRIVNVVGTAEGTEMVRRMIETISAEQSAACVMSGHFEQYQARQQAGHYAGQPVAQDPTQQYSADWAAYHAAQATAQQQISQQPQQQQQQSQLATNLAPDAYYEQFFRYAYYYGEDAARTYYGAWSPPLGTPNPYGVNPALGVPPASNSGSTAAATQSMPPSSVGAAETEDPMTTTTKVPAATAAAPAVRDSSQRRVSNLPAWMTKS